MTSWARPGVKVVCVAGDGPLRSMAIGHVPKNGYPKERGIYTITSVLVHPLTDTTSVTLAELPNPANLNGVDYGFALARFRPLVTQDQDVAMFRHLLTKQGVDA